MSQMNADNRASTETTLSFQPTAFVGRLLVSAFSVSAFQRFSARLRAYFRSGWAFLIPYLAAYLLYYVLKWPVNPAAAGVKVRVASESRTWVPCLLHVYWFLHAVNLVLAAIALRAWWKEKHRFGDATPPSRSDSDGDEGVAAPSHDSEPTVSTASKLDTPAARGAIASQQAPPASGFSFSAFQLSAFRDAIQRLAPWFLLGLLFWIPGVYLEYPADPWEHYRRINEWSWLHTVGEHSAWTKSSYFLAYSLVGHIAPPIRQLFWLDFYYTGVCLLLCWQFYRLSRAVGLGERASMLFVVLQTVLFGNNIFGFYRYYGISSSIFAQIGAVALVRVAIELASAKVQIPKAKSQGTDPEVLQEVTEGSEQRDEGVASPSPSPLSSLPSVRTDQSAPTNSYESTRIE